MKEEILRKARTSGDFQIEDSLTQRHIGSVPFSFELKLKRYENEYIIEDQRFRHYIDLTIDEIEDLFGSRNIEPHQLFSYYIDSFIRYLILLKKKMNDQISIDDPHALSIIHKIDSVIDKYISETDSQLNDYDQLGLGFLAS